MKENNCSKELDFLKEKINKLLAKDAPPEKTVAELLNAYHKLATTVMYMQYMESFVMKNEICRHAIDVLTEAESEEAYDRVVEICSMQKDMIEIFYQKVKEAI